MRSRRLPINIPWNLYEASRSRSAAEKYRNYQRYIIGLIIRDVVRRESHLVFPMIANLDPEEQDDVIEYFLQHEERVREALFEALQADVRARKKKRRR